MLHFKKTSSRRSSSDIRACPIWTKNQTTITKYSSTGALDVGMTKERRTAGISLSYVD